MICLHINQKAHVACNLSFVVKNEGVFKVTGSHIHVKSGSVLKTVLDNHVETTVHKHKVICHTVIIKATMMTLGVFQGHSSIASFFSILTSASHGLSAIASLLINLERMKGWVDLVGWSVAGGLPSIMVSHQLQVEHGWRKFASKRPTFYHRAYVTFVNFGK